MSIKYSVQLYTLREELKKDFIGTLEKVAALGYSGVEFAGFGELAAEDMRKKLHELGLTAVSSHFLLEEIEEKLQWIIDYSKIIGSKYIVCCWANPKSKEDFLTLAERCNRVGEALSKEGLTFCYHNHDHEFVDIDGVYGLDILYSGTNPEYVKAEMDTYWLQYAGINPAEYIRKYGGRIPIIHLKDMEDTPERAFAEVGTGVMDFESIIKAGKEAGVEYFVVEQDKCKREAMERIAISYNNLVNMNL